MGGFDSLYSMLPSICWLGEGHLKVCWKRMLFWASSHGSCLASIDFSPPGPQGRLPQCTFRAGVFPFCRTAFWHDFLQIKWWERGGSKSINHFVNSFQLHYIQHHRQKKKLLLPETGGCSFKNLRLDAGCIVVELSRVLWLEVVTWELAYPRSGKPRKEWGLLGIE